MSPKDNQNGAENGAKPKDPDPHRHTSPGPIYSLTLLVMMRWRQIALSSTRVVFGRPFYEFSRCTNSRSGYSMLLLPLESANGYYKPICLGSTTRAIQTSQRATVSTVLKPTSMRSITPVDRLLFVCDRKQFWNLTSGKEYIMGMI